MTLDYRAEGVGSLLRPADLLQARAAFAEGRVGLDELRAEEDRSIERVLRRQREIDLDVVTDGELRRGSWLAEMADAVDGFVPEHVLLDWKGPGAAVEPTQARVVGEPLRPGRHLAAHEVPFLKLARLTTGRPFKVTLPAPSNFMFASYKSGVTDRFYATRESLLARVAEIVRDEIQWLAAEDVAYVQLDAPYYSHYLDEVQRGRMKQDGVDPDLALAAAIEGDNVALGAARASAGPDVTTALHVCRGNNRSRWYTEGAYDAIAERLFATLDVDRFLLEYDDSRSGDFEPLRLLPSGAKVSKGPHGRKTAVLGLVTTKRSALESEDDLLRRIDEASRHVPLEQLALSPQCGFASIAAGNLLSEDDQWRKLELVVRTARRVWGDR